MYWGWVYYMYWRCKIKWFLVTPHSAVAEFQHNILLNPHKLEDGVTYMGSTDVKTVSSNIIHHAQLYFLGNVFDDLKN